MVEETDRLVETIAMMNLKDKFYGHLFARIEKEKDENVDVAGITLTKKRIVLKYNPNKINNTEIATIEKILIHEALHILNKHPTRIMKILKNDKKTNLRKINIAADLVVNYLMKMPEKLIIDGELFSPCLVKNFGLKENLSMETYYQLLSDMSIPDNGFCHNWFGNCDADNILENFDDEDIFQIDTEIYKNIKSAMHSFSKTRGTLPDQIRKLIEDLLKIPELPYYQIIKKLIVGRLFSHYKLHSQKINKKRLSLFKNNLLPFPGRRRENTYKIGLLIDTSGSRQIDDMIEDLSAARDFLENHAQIIIIQIDTDIQYEKKIKSLSELKNIEIRGGGGTTLGPALKRFKELNVDVVVGFTDGMCEDLHSYASKELPKRMIWCVPEEFESIARNNLVGSTIIKIPKERRGNYKEI